MFAQLKTTLRVLIFLWNQVAYFSSNLNIFSEYYACQSSGFESTYFRPSCCKSVTRNKRVLTGREIYIDEICFLKRGLFLQRRTLHERRAYFPEIFGSPNYQNFSWMRKDGRRKFIFLDLQTNWKLTFITASVEICNFFT